MTTAQVPPPLDRMRLSDVDEVMHIERAVFPTPWSPRAFRYDLGMERHSHYFVLRGWVDGMPPLLGYAGFWLWGDEAHVGTIAVHPEWQRNGLGEWILLGVVQRAARLRAEMITLEVRVTNQPAQALYRKLGFETAGRRRRYYYDTGEDAIIMTLAGLRRTETRSLVADQVAAAKRRLQVRFASPALAHAQPANTGLRGE
jgi:ribosomal-protein-alanine N-acetyltransferase